MKNRIEWVDSLKGIAMCMIVFIHSGGSNLDGFIGRIGSIGGFGVSAFFMIYGYLVSLAGPEKTAQKKWGGGYASWIVGRFVRLIPMYYLFLVLYIFVIGGNTYFLGDEKTITVANIITHVLFINGFFPHYANSIIGVEWYIAVTVVFIVFIPFLWKVIKNLEKSFSWLVVCSFLCACICSALNYAVPQTGDTYPYTDYLGICFFLTHLPSLLVGRLLYFMERNWLSKVKGENQVLPFAMLFFSCWMIAGEILGKNDLFGVGKYTLFCLWFFMMAVSQIIRPCRLITNSVFGFIGKHSYGIYLSHVLIIYLWNMYVGYADNTMGFLIKYIIVVLASLCVSLVLEQCYEKPLVHFLTTKLQKVPFMIKNDENEKCN